jgi:hypothetical protein
MARFMGVTDDEPARWPGGGARSASSPRSFLFVHGAWHGPWCWQDHWLRYFQDAGHHADAIALGSHDRPGSRQRIWTTIRGHVAEVRERLA